MKTINVTFEDKEIKDMKADKGNLSWHDYIIFMWKKLILFKKGELQQSKSNEAVKNKK